MKETGGLRQNRGLWTRLAGYRSRAPRLPDVRPPHTHVVLLDGTMSSLKPGCETNIGLTYRLLSDLPRDAHLTLYYEPGIQWRGVRRAHEVIAGVGINRQIRRAYLFLARNYRPGDRVVLMGYSRGAYAVRSLAGLIDRMGLLRTAQIDEENARPCLRISNRNAPESPQARALRDARCHTHVEVAFLGVYDTVRARWASAGRSSGGSRPCRTPYHSHALGPSTCVARHALALDETRDAYAPVLWDVAPELAASGAVQQMWFRGAHGDVGGAAGRLHARTAAGEHRACLDAGGGRDRRPAASRRSGGRATSPTPRPRPAGPGAGPDDCSSRGARARWASIRPNACTRPHALPLPLAACGCPMPRPPERFGQPPPGLARRVGSAVVGFSGQGCLGYCARMSLRTSA